MLSKPEFDLGIHARFVMTFIQGEFQVRENVFMGILGTRIALMETGDGRSHATKKRIDAPNSVLLPGLINAHTHLPMSLFRGLADDASLKEWLFDTIFPLEAEFANEEFCTAGTELSLLEMIAGGTTTVGEMYFHTGAVAEAIDRAGVRAVIGPEIKVIPQDQQPIAGYVDSFERIRSLRSLYRDHPRIEVGYGPHAPYTVSDETLLRIAAEANAEQVPILIHVSESRAEVEESLKLYGKTPIERLYDLGVLRRRTVLAHCVHLTENDRALLKKTGASVVYNPDSNMKLGSGAADIVSLLRAGIAVGLGTDGAASNNDLSLFREMDSAAKLQKLAGGDPLAMGAKDAFRLATLGGACALGLEDRVGSLEVGKEADFCLLSLDYPHLQPVYDLVSTVVYAATGLEVTHTAVAGRLIYEDKQHISLDKMSIFEKSAKITQSVKRARAAAHPAR